MLMHFFFCVCVAAIGTSVLNYLAQCLKVGQCKMTLIVGKSFLACDLDTWTGVWTQLPYPVSALGCVWWKQGWCAAARSAFVSTLRLHLGILFVEMLSFALKMPEFCSQQFVYRCLCGYSQSISKTGSVLYWSVVDLLIMWLHCLGLIFKYILSI